jgi:N-acetylmuramoyl-L-alanine amidase
VTASLAIISALVCAMLCDRRLGCRERGDRTCACGRVEQEVVATDLRIGGDDKQTRFVVDLNRKIDLAAFTLADPYRVVVDLPQVNFKLAAKAGMQSRGLVKAYRYGLIMQGGSRIVLDTKGPVRIEKAFVLDAAEGQPARLVLDLAAIDRAAFMRNISLQTRPAHNTGAKPNEPPVKADGDARPLIVVDPGHGGIDNGTKGSGGELKGFVLPSRRCFARSLKAGENTASQ